MRILGKWRHEQREGSISEKEKGELLLFLQVRSLCKHPLAIYRVKKKVKNVSLDTSWSVRII